MTAKGPFTVKLVPLEPGAGGIGRLTIDKAFQGDLEATSVGQMMAYQNADKTSGGYVAMELVTGTLHGRRGSFMLQHSATMSKGSPDMRIIVIPGSGTGELEGLAGNLAIEVAKDGQHGYVLESTLP
jgi:Protein of unknown function (DUF3224)